MRRRKRNPRAPGAAAHDAGAVIDRVEPVIEVQLERLAIALGRIARVLPVKGASGLLAGGFAFQAILVAGVPALAELVNRPAQRVAMAVIEGVGLGQDDGVGVRVQLAMSLDRRSLQKPADKAFNHHPSFQAAHEETLREEYRRGASERIYGHGFSSELDDDISRRSAAGSSGWKSRLVRWVPAVCRSLRPSFAFSTAPGEHVDKPGPAVWESLTRAKRREQAGAGRIRPSKERSRC